MPDSRIVAIDGLIDGEAQSILLYCDGRGLRAWLNVCPHQGRRLDYAPGRFLVEGGRLVCAAHGATFKLADGECVAGPCRGSSLRAVPVDTDDEGRIRLGSLKTSG